MKTAIDDIESTDLLLLKVQKELLYDELITQLEKDFTRANQNILVYEKMSPEILKTELKNRVCQLIENDSSQYLSLLLYIIDVSETEIKSITATDLNQYSEQISFLILKREWQKICFKKIHQK